MSNSGHTDAPAPDRGLGDQASARKPWWKRWWGIVLVVLGVFILLGSLTDSPEDETDPVGSGTVTEAETAQPEATEGSAPDPTEEPSEELDEIAEEQVSEDAQQADATPGGDLGMTPDEFQTSWNSATEEFDSPQLRIDTITVQDGEVQDVFQVELAPYMYLQGSVHKADGLVRELTILAQPDGQDQALTVLTGWGLVVASTNPELSADERGEVLEDLGITDDSTDFSDHEARTTRGQVEYSVQFSDVMGLLFFATDARE